MKENIIETKTLNFAIEIINLYEELVSEKEFILSKQLLRSGTSIGANVQEASAAFSKKDFTFKMSNASKEARETRYWLILLEKSGLTQISLESHLKEIENIINILTKIVKMSMERD